MGGQDDSCQLSEDQWFVFTAQTIGRLWPKLHVWVRVWVASQLPICKSLTYKSFYSRTVFINSYLKKQFSFSQRNNATYFEEPSQCPRETPY